MGLFDCCENCLPPKRSEGCHAHCQEYLKNKIKKKLLKKLSKDQDNFEDYYFKQRAKNFYASIMYDKK